IWAQELVLVQQLGQHSPQPGFVQDRAESPAAVTLLERVMDRLDQLWSGFEKPAHALQRLWILLDEFPLKESDRAQRKQAYQRTNLQALTAAIGKPQHVVEEPVLLIPHAGVFTGARH